MTATPSSPAASPGSAAPQPAAAPQQPAAVEPDGSETTPAEGTPAPETVSKADLDDAIGRRQAALDRARTAEADLAEANKKLAEVPSPDELSAYQAWKADADAQERDAAIKKGDVESLEAKIREPLVAQIKAKDEKIASLEGQLTTVLVDAALSTAATDAGAHNPEQVVALLRPRVQMKATETGQYVPQFMDVDGQAAFDANGQRVADAGVFVKLFLALPENANLVTATLSPGSGAQPPGAPPQPQQAGMPRTLEEFNALPAEKKAEVARSMTPEQRQAFLGVQQPAKGGYI